MYSGKSDRSTCTHNRPVPAQYRIQVALLEDDPLMRTRLESALARDDGCTVVWAGDSVRACIAWLQTHAPHLLLVDLGLPDGSGLEVIRRCRALHPACDVLVISLFGDDSHLLAAFAAGASGYLLKDGSERDLLQHVRELRAGGSPMSPVVARRLLEHWQSRLAPTPPPSAAGAVPATPDRPAAPAVRIDRRDLLTPKETAVLGLVARGHSYDEVAQRLEVSGATVRTHVRSIYDKLGAHNKVQALLEARQRGWIQ